MISYVKISSNICEKIGAIWDAVAKNVECKGNFQYENSWRVSIPEGKTLTLQEKGKQRRDIGILFGWGFLMQNEKVRTGSKPDDKNFF